MRKLILVILVAFAFSALSPAIADAAQASNTQHLVAGKKGNVGPKSRAARKQKKKQLKKKQKRAAKKAERKARRHA
jgi:hypothetical protein